MHTNNVEPRRSWRRALRRGGTELDELGFDCLSCRRPASAGELFCDDCRERSRQSALSPEWDDLGVGD